MGQEPTSPNGWRSIEGPIPWEAGESHSRFLHVAEQGTYLRRVGSRVCLTRKDAILLQVPAAKLQGVVLYGNIQVSSQCLRNLLDEGVWLSFFTRNGVYKGRLQPPVERGGRLRLRQWERSRDPQFCLDSSRAIVRGKLLSQKNIAAAYAKNYLAVTMGNSFGCLRDGLERLESATELDQLRGIEGAATRAYFDLFRRWNQSEIAFDGREKHPPTDPINALLSFGYTLLSRELEGLLEAAGLDPTVGFYHQAHADRPSLACDWVEEFRHLVVDRVVLFLINRRIVTSADFEDRGEKGGMRLSQEGLRKFLRAYERSLIGLPASEPKTLDASAKPQPWTTGNTELVARTAEAQTAAPSSRRPGFRSLFLQQLARLLDALSKQAPYRTHLESCGAPLPGDAPPPE
jgi:CRISPR-associated protein Cas1